MGDLKDNTFLCHFSDVERTWLIDECKVINGPKGIDFLIKDLYFLLEGFVALTNEQNTCIENIIGPNSILGNTKLIQTNTLLTVRMLSNAKFLHVPHNVYLKMLENINFTKTVIHKLSEMHERANYRLYLNSEDSMTRVWKTLLLLFQDHGVTNEDELLVLPFRLINRDLANYCGTTRETVNRSLRKLVKDKYIQMGHGKLVLLAANELKKVA